MPFPYTFPIIFGVLPAMTVNIDGDIPRLKKGSLSVDLRIEERSTAQFIVVDILGTASYQDGQPVTIYDITDTRLFGGVIDGPERVAMAPGGGLYHAIRCKDWHYLADKRLVAESYLATDAGDIVADIRTDYLADEGVTVGSIEPGPEIVEAVFNYVRATDAFDALAEKAGKIWYIDENKALYFVDRDVTVAPFTATAANMDRCRLSGGNPKYRNRQYIRGGRGTTALQTETFTGDGVSVAFTVGFPIVKVPTVTVNAVGQTVGIKGIDTTQDCYWNKGDATVTFDAGSIPGAVAVVIAYYGQFDILILAEDTDAIATRLAIESSGTGYVDDIADEPTLNDKDASIDSGRVKLARFTPDSVRLNYETVETGLRPGQLQTVNYSLLGLNSAEMLIEALTMRASGNLITYDVTAIQGPELGSWTNFFKALADQKQEVIDRLNVGSNQILIILVQREENWEWEETIVETVWACTAVDSVVCGGATPIVC